MEIQPLFDKYQKLLAEQVKLDDLSLKEQQLKLPGYKHYWASRCITHKQDKARLRREREKTRKELRKRIEDEAEVEISFRAIDSKVDQLDEIQNFEQEIEQMEMLIEFVEKAEQIMKSMSFDIGNLIKLQQLETM